MQWSIPYSPGSMSDQSVMLLRAFDVINRAKNKHEKEQQEKREQEMKSRKTSGGGKGRRRR